jgi:hypothetical protein
MGVILDELQATNPLKTQAEAVGHGAMMESLMLLRY